MEKGVRGRAQTAGANSRRGTTKKHKISRTLFSTNLHFLVEFLTLPLQACPLTVTLVRVTLQLQ